MLKNNRKNLEIIGANTFVAIEGIENIPAKIDTGADSSSVHVDNISVSKDGTLSFELFGKKIERKEFRAVVVRSSNGEEEIRFRAPLSVKIGSKKIKAFFTLANREKNDFPVLIGRKTIKNKFIVDVSEREIPLKKRLRSKRLNQELQKNPYEFHQKYIKLSEKED